ncbi:MULTISPECIES: hypothetical protein [unclassified Janibacter]|uniref:hypothetical protein n=1 Tax=unclassified Janibacter TaxID=2649294 RepID=UPI003D09144D
MNVLILIVRLVLGGLLIAAGGGSLRAGAATLARGYETLGLGTERSDLLARVLPVAQIVLGVLLWITGGWLLLLVALVVALAAALLALIAARTIDAAAGAPSGDAMVAGLAVPQLLHVDRRFMATQLGVALAALITVGGATAQHGLVHLIGWGWFIGLLVLAGLAAAAFVARRRGVTVDGLRDRVPSRRPGQRGPRPRTDFGPAAGTELTGLLVTDPSGREQDLAEALRAAPTAEHVLFWRGGCERSLATLDAVVPAVESGRLVVLNSGPIEDALRDGLPDGPVLASESGAAAAAFGVPGTPIAFPISDGRTTGEAIVGTDRVVAALTGADLTLSSR